MIVLAIWAVVIAGVVLAWLIFRSGGYKRVPLDLPPGAGWELTDERFFDPKTGEKLEVWFCPRSGERAYVRAQR